MSSQTDKRIELEIVHVLFLDIVGYSKPCSDEQHALIELIDTLHKKPGLH